MATRLPAEHRREQLLEVAVDLFSRKGFKGTTTREIAATAGVTEAVIFRHFATKEQLYTAIIDRKAQSFDEWVLSMQQEMDANHDEQVIRSLIAAIILTHKTDSKFERVMLYAALERNEIALGHMCQVSEGVLGTLRQYLIRRQGEGAFAQVDPDAALIAIIGMAFYYAQTTYIHELAQECLSDETAVESFVQIAMQGLRATVTSKRRATR